MVIAINTLALVDDELDYKSIFLKEVFNQIVRQNPTHQFIFIFNNTNSGRFNSEKNTTSIIVTPVLWAKGLSRHWYNIKLSIALKKHNPDLLIQTTGVCSSVIPYPQLLVLDDTNNCTRKSIIKAKQIIVSSNAIKNEILKKNNIDGDKIIVIEGAAKAFFKPLGFEEIMQVKDGYADGRDFFLLSEDENLMNVLKAFSIFKKWQRSSMKLLVVVSSINQNKRMIQLLDTYKYRDDVILLSNLDEYKLAKLTASAYCVLLPTFNFNFPLRVIEAMQSGVPVIASNNVCENIENFVLYASADDSQKIAEQMQLIYKDEILRSKLVKEGYEKAASFTWEKTVDSFWDSILRSIK